MLRSLSLALVLALSATPLALAQLGEARPADRVALEAYLALERPTDEEYGLGLIWGAEARLSVSEMANGFVRGRVCGQPLGCVKFLPNALGPPACIIVIERGLPDFVRTGTLRYLTAECGRGPGY